MSETMYALLDTGNGRRLERIGGVVIDRPAPAADWPAKLAKASWQAASLCFAASRGWQGTAPEQWRITRGGVTLGLRPAAGGQIGIFPEHAAVCDQLDSFLSQRVPSAIGWRALSLFGHTGMATLRLARHVHVSETVHVDAQPSAVKQGKNNAVLSSLADRHIRWLVDDASAFLAREQRRERFYDIILADPPAYGRDKKTGGEWKLERDLPGLIAAAAGRLGPGGLLCLTCHPAGWTVETLVREIRRVESGFTVLTSAALSLAPESGNRALPAGIMAIAGKPQ